MNGETCRQLPHDIGEVSGLVSSRRNLRAIPMMIRWRLAQRLKYVLAVHRVTHPDDGVACLPNRRDMGWEILLHFGCTVSRD